MPLALGPGMYSLSEGEKVEHPSKIPQTDGDRPAEDKRVRGERTSVVGGHLFLFQLPRLPK